MTTAADLREGDLVAVPASIGSMWLGLIENAWRARAALLPVDERLARAEREALLARARPTVVLDGTERFTRPESGRPVSPEAMFVFPTSGTSGASKLVELTRAAVRAAIAGSTERLGAGAADAWVSCLPPAHIGGMLVLLRGVFAGNPVSIVERFSPLSVADVRGRFVSLVPTMLTRMLDAGVDLSSYRGLLIGGGALRSDLRERAEEAGLPIVETYGLTESCGGVVYDGRPFRGTEVRIVEGAIELRGPTLMTRYLDAPEATAAAFDDGWLRTGDAGEIDAEARLRVFGRVDDVINSGGEKIWPEEVEAAVATHPGVADVAVAGREDAEWGHRVVAFVVPADPSAPPTLDDLREYASATLARFKAPRELVVVNAIPRTPSGKVRRSAPIAR